MLYIHDVWVNWAEDPLFSTEVLEFHEWSIEDTISLLDRTAIIHVTPGTFDSAEGTFEFNTVPDDLLRMICQKSYFREGKKRYVLEYCCIISDGNRNLTINLEEKHGIRVIKKSRLIPRQDNLVTDMLANGEEKYEFDFKPYLNNSSDIKETFGLTRKERKKKQILSHTIRDLINEDNLEKMKYWLTEVDPKNFYRIKRMKLDTVKSKLQEFSRSKWSLSHEEIGNKLVVSHPVYKYDWDKLARVAFDSVS